MLLLLVVGAVAPPPVRVISFDVTGTLVTHREPVMKSYADAAIWARLPEPPSQAELKPAFRQAYQESLTTLPCFGGADGVSGRDWWRATIRRVLELCGRAYTEAEFERYFRRVYQHFGSPSGYETLDDADALLAWLEERAPDLQLGITSNTPQRHMESVLPSMLVRSNLSTSDSSLRCCPPLSARTAH